MGPKGLKARRHTGTMAGGEVNKPIWENPAVIIFGLVGVGFCAMVMYIVCFIAGMRGKLDVKKREEGESNSTLKFKKPGS